MPVMTVAQTFRVARRLTLESYERTIELLLDPMNDYAGHDFDADIARAEEERLSRSIAHVVDTCGHPLDALLDYGRDIERREGAHVRFQMNDLTLRSASFTLASLDDLWRFRNLVDTALAEGMRPLCEKCGCLSDDTERCDLCGAALA